MCDDLYQTSFFILTTITMVQSLQLAIEGEMECRLGMLLLSGGQVQVLGGQVEQLVDANSPRKVLARLL